MLENKENPPSKKTSKPQKSSNFKKQLVNQTGCFFSKKECQKNIFLVFLLFTVLSVSIFFSDFYAVVRGAVGLFFFVALAYLFSPNKRKIAWSLILQTLIFQIVMALLILKVPMIGSFFQSISECFIEVVGYSRKGAQFLLASFISGEIESPLINFVSIVLPSVLFFSAITSVLYHYRIIQRLVYVLAWITRKTLKISGAESLTVCGSIFLSQVEVGLLIRNYLPTMNRSEIMLFMTSGMATVSGSVLATYVYFLGGDDPIQQAFFAKHFMVASLISAPAAILMAKILVPQTEIIQENHLMLDKKKTSNNLLDAIASGTSDGLRLAVSIAAILLVIISLFALINDFVLTGIIGKYTGLNDWIQANTAYPSLSLQFILGYLLLPLVYMMGVATEDLTAVAQLIGEKTILNEFVAYANLGKMKVDGVFTEFKSVIIATYALCGFSNFGSIGIQVSGIGDLVPSQRKVLSSLGFYALLAASLACICTGIVAGMFS